MEPFQLISTSNQRQVVKFYSTETEVMYFGVIGGIAILLGIILYLFSPKLKEFMRGLN